MISGFIQDIQNHPIRYISIYIMVLSVFYIWMTTRVPPLPRNPKHIDAIINTFETFDIIHFTCFEYTSYIGKIFQKSAYTHIAMIVKLRGRYYLWEADNHNDINRPGITLLPMKKIMDDYPTNHYALQKINIPNDKRERALKEFDKLYQELEGRDFKFSISLFLNALYKKNIETTETSQDKLFCSELIAETYKRCGLMKDELPSWTYTPRDFYFKDIPLEKDISWGEIVPFYVDK